MECIQNSNTTLSEVSYKSYDMNGRERQLWKFPPVSAAKVRAFLFSGPECQCFEVMQMPARHYLFDPPIVAAHFLDGSVFFRESTVDTCTCT